MIVSLFPVNAIWVNSYKAMANLLGHELAEARPDKLSAGQLVSYILG
ncbi:hypothetical protein PYU99_11215 [Aeromonas media]|nr:hypothetical protein [Aeromonas media]WED79572.1 hypothetical protein PYU99_11215 [Aeromonas media]